MNIAATFYLDIRNSVLIHGVEYDINDCIVYSFSSNPKEIKRAEIEYLEDGSAVFQAGRHQVPLNECLRMDC
jgi:hypothetical protein